MPQFDSPFNPSASPGRRSRDSVAAVEGEVARVAVRKGLTPAVLLEGANDTWIVQAFLRDVDRGAELVPGQPGRSTQIRTALGVAADRAAGPPLLGAGSIAVHDRDRNPDLPLRLQERPHRD